MLKWPYHLWHLDALLKTFADATIIHLHRDPAQAVPSVCSLAAAARAPFCERIEAEALGRFWLDYCEAGLKRSLMVRNQAWADRIIDIRYPDLKRNPLSVMKTIQQKINLDEPGTWATSLRAGLERKALTRHQYAGGQFGLEADQIRERFFRYIQKYDLSLS